MNKRKKWKSPVQTTKYDLASNSSGRLIRFALFARFVPVGNLAGGPGVRCMLILFLLHTFGRPLYWLNTRYGARFTRIRVWLRKRQK